MKVIVIIDKFLDEREFRNYSSYWLTKLGFDKVEIEDPRLSDDDLNNNNDIYAIKNKQYTAQTFLNKNLTKKELKETLNDMKKENIENGLIITNREVSDEFREYALEHSVEIIDRQYFDEEL